MTVITKKLGPGTLKIGDVGTGLDVSCQINGCRIAASKDQGDSTTKLCGDVVPGAVTYTYELSGNIDVDIATDEGLFALSYTAKGTEVPFSYTPNNKVGTTAVGTLVLDPLDFGADNYGDDLTSDFSFAIVGEPSFRYGTPPPFTADDVAPAAAGPETPAPDTTDDVAPAAAAPETAADEPAPAPAHA